MKKIKHIAGMVILIFSLNLVQGQTLTAAEIAQLKKEGWQQTTNGKMNPPANFNKNQPSSDAQRKALGWKFSAVSKSGALIPPPMPKAQQDLIAADRKKAGWRPGADGKLLPPPPSAAQTANGSVKQQYGPLPSLNNDASKKKLNYGGLPPENNRQKKKLNYTELPKENTRNRGPVKYGMLPANQASKQPVKYSKFSNSAPPVQQASNPNRSARQRQQGQQKVQAAQKQRLRQMVKDVPGPYTPISAKPQNPDGSNKKTKVAGNQSQNAQKNRGKGVNRLKVSGSNHQKIPAAPKSTKTTKPNPNKIKKKGRMIRAKSKVKKVFKRKR